MLCVRPFTDASTCILSDVFITAIIGVVYVRYEGFNTLRSGISQLIKNQMPMYEIISGAALAFAAFLLILPGFLTDIVGFLLIFPPTRKLLLGKFTNSSSNQKKQKQDFINGEIEDIDDDKDGKI